MARYRKLPLLVEAMQWNGIENEPHYGDLFRFVLERVGPGPNDESVPLVHFPDDSLLVWVDKSARRCRLDRGGWIIAEPDGRGVYPCTKEDFERGYEEVEDCDGVVFDTIHPFGCRLVRGHSGAHEATYADALPRP